MTRPPPGDRLPEPVADTRRRIRSTTWLAAGAATAASALFGVLFAQSDPAPAAADPDLPSVTLPSIAPHVAGPHPPTARHTHAHPVPSSAPKALQPPVQPPRRATGPGRTTSGAS